MDLLNYKYLKINNLNCSETLKKNIDFFRIKILQYSRKIDAEYRKIFYLSDFYSKIFRPPAGI